ncbi:TetR/AcrR family transcriptional regulator [Paenibacillus sp. NPDC058177]|uniref:TetR/AcrR family transcriptional regulator n=1 Tax=Paenibacillus sp. NPDC058177 TaxID=3346369 RepID=UPI0036DF6D86
MPYPEGHKERVRKEIIESAGIAFRVNGIQATSLPIIMKGAGLTHGGFYAHFSSKEQLLSEACHYVVSETLELLGQIADKETHGYKIDAVIDYYLSTFHRDDAKTGCLFPILTSEITRSSQEIRLIYNRELNRFIDFIANVSGKNTSASSALLSTMVGTLMLARSVVNLSESDKVLEAGRQQAKAMIMN